MKKKDVLTVLKRKFMDTNTSTSQMKQIKELYKEVKGLVISDTDNVPKHIEMKFRAIR